MATQDYDAMFRASQKNNYPKPGQEQPAQEEPLHQILKQGEYGSSDGTMPQPQPYEPQPYEPQIKQKSGFSPEYLGIISIIIGIVGFILIFVGMFLHFFMWLNILILLTGIGFGIAALLKKALNRVFGIIGIVIGIFNLLVQLICMIVVLISSGISAAVNLFT